MDIKKKLGKRIKELRNEKKISQEKLAFRAKIHRTYLSDVERGVKNISLENIEKISIALEKDIKDLFIF